MMVTMTMMIIIYYNYDHDDHDHDHDVVEEQEDNVEEEHDDWLLLHIVTIWCRQLCISFGPQELWVAKSKHGALRLSFGRCSANGSTLEAEPEITMSSWESWTPSGNER